MKRSWVLAATLGLLALAAVASAAQTNSVGVKFAVQEVSLGAVPASASRVPPAISADSRHIAFVVLRGGKWGVCRDGVEGDPYARIEGLLFSPDGQRLAVAARKALDRQVVVVDGAEGKEYETLDGTSLTFSPDSRRLAFIAGPPGSARVFVVLDGKQGPDYEAIAGRGPGKPQLFFSPDSQKLAYGAGLKTPAGNPPAFEIVVEGPQRKAYPARHRAVVYGFSPDSQQLAWMDQSEARRRVVVDGKAARDYDEIGADSFRFSPDGQRTAYFARQDSKWRIVVDGQEGAQFDGLGDYAPIFSADGRRLAYVAVAGARRCVVVDGQRGKAYDDIGPKSLQFSPDGRHVAFAAVAGGRHYVVRDGKESEGYDDLKAAMLFSPDSQHLAYVAEFGGRLRFVLDGVAGQAYDGLANRWLCFSPDSKHLAYGALQGRKLVVVVDGQEVGDYEGNLGTLAFDGPGLLRGLATRMDQKFNLEIVRLEIALTAP
jgi:Tol biopolymer transport system component